MRWWNLVVCVVACGCGDSKLQPDAAPDVPDAPVCHLPPVSSDVTACDGIGYGLPAVGVGGAHVMSQLADVSGDGKLDLVAPSFAPSGGVTVALGNGDGTFATPVNYAAGGEPVGVAVGDLDGDAAADLAVVSQADNLVFVLLNQGSGSFGAATSYAVGAGPRAVVIGDLEPDGDMDVVVASYTSNTVTILRNAGTGSFATPTMLAVSQPWRLALGRLDTDTHPDLVVVGFGANTVFKNAGDGTFPSGTSFGIGQTNDVAIADFNGDGEGDVALATPSGISVYPGKGNATLDLPILFNFRVAYGITAGDFDGNGKPDVVATGWDGVTVLLRGATEFAQTTYPLHAPAGGNDAVTNGDIDGDGDLDLAIASVNSANGIAILQNPGGGDFIAVTLLDSTAISAIGSGDIDGDDRDDVIYVDGNQHLRVYVNGTLTADHAVGRFAFAIAVADVTNDGKADVIASTDRDVHVFVGQGGGALAPGVVYATGVESFEISVVDLDGDGARDIIVPHPLPPMPAENGQTVGVLRNNGDGTFAAQKTYPIGGTMSAAAIADFNGDCKVDIVVASQGPYELELLPGAGDGTFGPKQVLPTDATDPAYAVVTADVDGDDKSDLILVTGAHLVVMRGLGDGTFERSSSVPLLFGFGGGAAPVRLVDFDGDARYDIVLSHATGLYVHHGNADGSFAPGRAYNMPGRPSLVGDLDGDRRIDVLALAGGSTIDDWRLYKVLGTCAP